MEKSNLPDPHIFKGNNTTLEELGEVQEPYLGLQRRVKKALKLNAVFF